LTPSPEAHDLVPYKVFAFKIGSAVKVLVIPENTTTSNLNPWCFLGVKGAGPSLTSVSTDDSPRAGAWGAYSAFIDDNDDIWLVGHPYPPGYDGLSPLTDELILWRITDVGGSTYGDYFSITMPQDGSDPEGYFVGGKFVGAWGDMHTGAAATLYFSVNLTTGVLETRDISANPVFVSSSRVGPSSFEFAPVQSVPPNPGHYFFFADDGTERTMRELLPDLTDGVEYSLDDWDADDEQQDELLSSTVIGPLYLDGPQAFCGSRRFYNDAPSFDNEHSDFYEYYFADGDSGGGAGGNDETTTIRCWPFSLDDHDFAVFRLGPSETLIVDLKTRQWAEWQSPGRTNWRAHIGCNWVGMTGTLADGGTDVVAGDDVTGVLWRLDPAYGRDDNTDTGSQSFTRKVTGQIPLDGRETLNCGALTLAMALGAPSQAGAIIILKTSDDLGRSGSTTAPRSSPPPITTP
jgi:hypothetical protein